jgi:hypothetical protein
MNNYQMLKKHCTTESPPTAEGIASRRGFERKCSWSMSGHFSSIQLETLRKPAKAGEPTYETLYDLNS